MRHRFTIAALVVLAFAAGLAVLTASIAATVLEDKSRADVDRVLGLNGIDWALVRASGLQIIIEGEAPDEAARFHAIRETGRVVDAARVIDAMTIHVPEPIKPPKFSVEILRNDDGISLIGLVPTETGQSGVADRVRVIAGDGQLVELLDEASFPAPAMWEIALDFGIDALADLPRSKISVSDGLVEIVASTDSAAQKRKVELDLRTAKPDGIELLLDIAAPRPVVTPYTLRFVKDERGTRFDACTSDTERGVSKILTAARVAGLTGQTRCNIALGVPSPEWDKAATLAIAALGELGQGTVTISDADIALIGVPELSSAEFDRVTGRLQSELPEAFSLTATLPEPEPEEGDDPGVGPPEFLVTLSPEGLAQLRGAIPDERTQTAVQSLARAKFSGANVDNATRLREEMPIGWGLRVFAAIEALSELKNGLARVTTDNIEVRGNTGNEDASAEVAALLSKRLGSDAQYTIDVTYQEALDPLASIPTPEECVQAINGVFETQKITFAPSSADIDDEGRKAIERIVEIMEDCEYVPMEVAGHTDSQGREVMNKELSQARADAVVNALLARRVLTTNMISIGYGEEQPIADNDTEEGREINRRIEFLLIADEPSQPAPEPAEPVEDVQDQEAAPETTTTDAAAEPAELEPPLAVIPKPDTSPLARPQAIEEAAAVEAEEQDPTQTETSDE